MTDDNKESEEVVRALLQIVADLDNHTARWLDSGRTIEELDAVVAEKIEILLSKGPEMNRPEYQVIIQEMLKKLTAAGRA